MKNHNEVNPNSGNNKLGKSTKKERILCKHKHSNVEDRTFRDGSHHLEKKCVDCGKQLGYVPQFGSSEKDVETHEKICALLDAPSALTSAEDAWLKQWIKKNKFAQWMRDLVSEKYSQLIDGGCDE